MEKKSLLQQQISGYQITLFHNGDITIQRDARIIGNGSLDSVVLTQWGEAHLDGCDARLGKTQDESYEIYDAIDDALSIAITQDETLRAQLILPRNQQQLELIAEDWAEKLSKEERASLIKNDPAVLSQKLARAEFLSPEQTQTTLQLILALLGG